MAAVAELSQCVLVGAHDHLIPDMKGRRSVTHGRGVYPLAMQRAWLCNTGHSRREVRKNGSCAKVDMYLNREVLKVRGGKSETPRFCVFARV